MNNVKSLLECVKIAYIGYLGYEAYEAYAKCISNESDEPEEKDEDTTNSKICTKTLKTQPMNTTSIEKRLCLTCMKQLKEKNEEDFFKASRMSVKNFDILLSQLKEKLQPKWNRTVTDPETRLAITLLYLAHGYSIKVIALCYKMGTTVVHKIIHETCDAICRELYNIYLSAPNSIEAVAISDNFYNKTGMPNCLGAIDGKCIHLTTPRRGRSLYSKTEQSHSMMLLAACDANYIFTHADTVALKNRNDADALTRSDFGSKLLNGTLEVPHDDELPGTTTLFQYYFIVDSTFPSKVNLMRPYAGQYLTEDKRNFNLILSKAHKYIENAFGLLATRWRVLNTEIQSSPMNADKIILATVLLHNFLMLHGDKNYFSPNMVDRTHYTQSILGQWRNDIKPLQSYQPRSANRSSTKAIESRDALKYYLQTYHNIT